MRGKKLFLIDGMSSAYRAFYAIRDLRNSSGEPTNAVYGFTTMLLKIVREQRPDACAVVFDSKTPTFRHERFNAYKAHRKPMPDDLVHQLPLIKEVIDAYRIRILQKDGVEADDLMGSMSRRAVAEGYDVYLVTSDKDMYQMVGKGISVLKPDTGEIIDPAGVMKRFGVGPEKIIDLLALAGDASDNVPGVPGIGEKTALELLTAHDSLEGVLANLDKIKGEKRRETLRANADQARLSRELVTLRCDISLECGPSACQMQEPDRHGIAALFQRLEFRKLQSAVVEAVAGGKAKAYRCVSEMASLDDLVSSIRAHKTVTVDLETTGLDPVIADPVGASFSMREGEAFYVPLNGALPKEAVFKRLRSVIEDEGIGKFGQNIKYDLLVLRRAGVELKNIAFDTMVAAYLLNPSRNRYGIDDLALEHLNMRVTPITDLIGRGKKQISMADVPVNTVCQYACEDADVALRLSAVLAQGLKEMELERLFRDVEMPLVRVLADMEWRGVRIDCKLLQSFSSELSRKLDGIEKSIYELAGERFNIQSPPQLRRILFEKLKLPVSRKIKTGYSTDYDALVGLAGRHPLPALLLEYRQLSKLKSTYVDALPEMVNPETGRVHTSFNQTGTATGRLSSSDPNLQNIPVRTELGLRIREAFVPGEEGMVFISADYSQIDLRILAHLSGDEELKGAFERDEDIHTRTASALFSVPASEVTPEMRRQAKTINFGIVYGMSAYGLSKELGIDPGKAGDYIRRYFEHYRGLAGYIERVVADAERQGYVTTILNRRRAIPELKSQSQTTREMGKRIAINTPIQGSSADLIKVAMLQIHNELNEKGFRAAMLIQIHDELLFEADREEADEVGALVKGIMEGVWKLSVPIKAHIKTGRNWGEL